MKPLRKTAALLAVLLAWALLALPAAAADESTGAIGGASFTVEQVYVNVPELDVFFYATDPNGAAITPTMVQAAGVELRLGDKALNTGTIIEATDPLCYFLVIDNSAPLSCKAGIRRLIANKREEDQVALFTLAGGLTCVQEATTDPAAALQALEAVRPGTGAADLAAAAAGVYQYVNENYPSLAPRKALFAFVPESAGMLASLPLLAALGDEETVAQLNMALCTLVLSDNRELFDRLHAEQTDRVELSGGRMVVIDPEQVGAFLLEQQQRMATALEIKTTLPESSYGERLELLTMTVPKLGSAVQSTATVYMGHRLLKPAVEKVAVLGRTRLEVTFNQAVANAGLPGNYIITSNDIWNFRVPVDKVELAENGRTAMLTMAEPLYEGNYGVALKNVTSRLTAANVSSRAAETGFRIAVWPRDQGFYLARLRLPLTLASLVLLALAGGNLYVQRKAHAAEKTAEAEHLLAGAGTVSVLPRRWMTLFIQRRRGIAETRWTGVVESSLLIGSDAAQCDLCLPDDRVAAQHCLIAVEGDALLIRPLGEARVRVNNEIVGGEYRLHNGDTIGLGRTTLRLVL
ncbi:MAG: FHA domain-containing protein [Gemmiger sp.]